MCEGRLRSIIDLAMNATDVTIRLARPEDARAVADLSVLDSADRPRGDVLVAEVDGSLWAAVSLEDRHAVADPFRPSGDLVPLLRERAHQIRPRRPHRTPEAGRRVLVRFPARSFTGEP
jgi:hypothetical protein